MHLQKKKLQKKKWKTPPFPAPLLLPLHIEYFNIYHNIDSRNTLFAKHPTTDMKVFFLVKCMHPSIYAHKPILQIWKETKLGENFSFIT